ncbi:MAG: hypothetical protein WDN69_22215 [Aliidongia sp.]
MTTLILATAAQANSAEIAAPKSAMLLLAAAATGVQFYSCEAHDHLYSWQFKSPEAVGRVGGQACRGEDAPSSPGSWTIGTDRH